ncbi:hypothetical protein GGI1_16569, partial [Acidithiobacillus sp. GGI-221]
NDPRDKAQKSCGYSEKQIVVACHDHGMDSIANIANAASKLAITLPELAAAIGANARSLRNALYLHPDQFPPAIYLPGTRGPRFLVSDVLIWLEARKTQPASPPAAPKSQGRPRKASPRQIASARQGKEGKGGAA